MEIILSLYVFALGLVIGSFLNVVIYRVPIGISIAKGRSFCPTCSHKLTALDLVPVFSFVFLRGKCRHCGTKIGAIYPTVELMTAVLYLLAWLRFGFSWQVLLLFVIFPCLVCLSFIDINHGIIPDRFHIIIAVCAVVMAFLPKDGGITQAGWVERIIGAVIISLPLAFIALIAGSMGWGDVKLFAACGFLLGWKLILLTMLFASVAAAVYSLIMVVAKKAGGKTAIPFGPFIAAAVTVSALYGRDIVNFYFSLF